MNRKNLKKIIKTIHLLCKQGSAFRGHGESASSNNRGNFMEVLKLLSEDDGDLNNHLKSKTSNYTCHDSQNEIISLIAGQIRIKNLPKPNQFFSIIADETLDVSKVEQVSFCLRYVNDDLSIQERFFGYFPTKIQTADAIFELLKSVIYSFKLDLNLLVGQAYDGAAVMSGIKNGVAVKFLELAKTAIYIHCHAHKLNLSLCDASMQVKDISDVLNTIQNASVFIQRSGKRFALFEHIKDGIKKERLKLFCATRWESCYRSIKAFVENFEYLITFLEVTTLNY